jgi:crossover junction endodeoxyribonuclease RusA
MATFGHSYATKEQTMASDPGCDTVDRLTRTSFFVPGKPAPQGSKRHVGRGILIESSKALGPWRERIAIVAREATGGAGPRMFTAGDPLAVHIEFVMPRPAGTPKSRTPAAVKRPDVDKLARAVLDAITDVLIHDDSAVVHLQATKRLAAIDEPPGADVTVAVIETAAA